ncbi:MAG: YCF48-related protein [Alphaproteobacteria bacterium]
MPVLPCIAAALTAVALMLLPTTADAQQDQPIPAIKAPLANQSLLLAGDRIGDRVVAVGARGHVLVSDDSGQSWTQLDAPVSTTLTAIDCDNASQSCLIGGHDGIVLNLDLSGEPRVTLRRFQPGGAEDLMKPVLAVSRMSDADIAFGAFGLALTGDATGSAEYDQQDQLPERIIEEEPHIGALTRIDDGVLIAGEFGAVFRKSDMAADWEDLSIEYEGSMFGALHLTNGSALIFGLQGKIFRLEDATTGEEWVEVFSDTTNGLMGGTVMTRGAVVLVGANGAVTTSTDYGRSFRFSRRKDRQTLSDVVEAPDGNLILLGEFGATRVSVEEVGQ